MLNKLIKTSKYNPNTIKLNNNGEIIEVKLRSSQRSKGIKIRVSAFHGVELVLPKAANYNSAHKFLLNNEEWVKRQFNKIKQPLLLAQKVVPVFGKPYTISYDNNNAKAPLLLDGDNIIVPNKLKDNANSIIEWYLRPLIKEEIMQCAQTISKSLGVRYKKITIKDTKTRWGSCSADGTLMFSWRLIFAPKPVIEYVVAHELCHLIEMNHSTRFWNLVEKVYPNYKEASSWLKKNGQSLHCYLRKVI